MKDRCVLKIVEGEAIYQTSSATNNHLAQPQGPRLSHARSSSLHLAKPHHSAFINPASGSGGHDVYGAATHGPPVSGYDSDSSARSAPPQLMQPPLTSDRQVRVRAIWGAILYGLLPCKELLFPCITKKEFLEGKETL